MSNSFMIVSMSSSNGPSATRLNAPLEWMIRFQARTGSSNGGEPYTQCVLFVLRLRLLGPNVLVISGKRLGLIPTFSQSSATASMMSGPSSA